MGKLKDLYLVLDNSKVTGFSLESGQLYQQIPDEMSLDEVAKIIDVKNAYYENDCLIYKEPDKITQTKEELQEEIKRLKEQLKEETDTNRKQIILEFEKTEKMVLETLDLVLSGGL